MCKEKCDNGDRRCFDCSYSELHEDTELDEVWCTFKNEVVDDDWCCDHYQE